MTMRVIARGVVSGDRPGSPRAVQTFPYVAALSGGALLASYRVGTNKDSAYGTVELRRSEDQGASWSEPRQPFSSTVGEARGSLRAAYVTELAPSRLLCACLWVDRETHPGRPLFNPDTEGCLPMHILLSDSHDDGHTWSPLRPVDTPDALGPPSLTSPVLRLRSGRLALSIESNKHYHDASPWLQRVTYLYSDDDGVSWGTPTVVAQDPTGRIFNWDQRAAVTADGDLVTFTWTYDSQQARYLNIHRRLSHDEGASWDEAQDLGFADQPSFPAVLADGSVVLAWVDRFGTQSIRARRAPAAAGAFAADGEVAVWDHAAQQRPRVDATGTLLSDMGLWSYGLPCATALGDGRVLVTFYAGDQRAMAIHWARLEV